MLAGTTDTADMNGTLTLMGGSAVPITVAPRRSRETCRGEGCTKRQTSARDDYMCHGCRNKFNAKTGYHLRSCVKCGRTKSFKGTQNKEYRCGLCRFFDERPGHSSSDVAASETALGSPLNEEGAVSGSRSQDSELTQEGTEEVDWARVSGFLEPMVEVDGGTGSLRYGRTGEMGATFPHTLWGSEEWRDTIFASSLNAVSLMDDEPTSRTALSTQPSWLFGTTHHA